MHSTQRRIGHTPSDLRKRPQNIVEVGGVEPACGVFVLAGQKVSVVLREGFQLTAGDLSWPLMAVIARPRRALAPFPRPRGVFCASVSMNAESAFQPRPAGVPLVL